MTTEDQVAFFLKELDTGDTGRRAAAAKGLGTLGSAEHSEALVRAAADPAPEVREGAAKGLGRLWIPVSEAGEQALLALMNDDDPRVRRQASVASLRLELRGDEVADAYGRLLGDPDHHIRINALEGLRTLGSPGDAAALVRLLGDPVYQIVGLARTLIDEVPDNPDIKAEAVRAAEFGADAVRAQVVTMLPDHDADQLLPSLLVDLRSNPLPETRIAVAHRLRRLDRAETWDALFAALETEQHPEVAAQLLWALGSTGDERLKSRAEHWLSDDHAGPAAAHALGSMGGAAAAALLRPIVTDPTASDHMRSTAAKAYGETLSRDAVGLLLPLLDHTEAEVRKGAVQGLEALVKSGLQPWERGAVAQALVANLATDKDVGWSTHAALWSLVEALPGVRQVVDEHPDVFVLLVALRLLDPHNVTDDDTPHDLARFVRSMDHPDSRIRNSATKGLAHWLEVTGTLPPDEDGLRERLAALSSDEVYYVRNAAAEALQALDGLRIR
ncbi:HEAT repeat domain-containing protein [Streptomyces sp. NPDC088387]|uniref:HEAT repeat domain-containing protein n=1 Tax=Streptomyces sp. NPDC088387 TaxID=3365859 RepID=UPI0038198075